MRQSLKQEKLAVGMGWDDLLGNATQSTSDGAKFQNFLNSFFAESIVTGDRYVQIYQLDKSRIDNLCKDLATSVIKKSDFHSVYPLPIDGKSISSAPSDPTLCEVRNLERGDIALVFCSARSYDDRNTYAYSELPEHIKKTYGEINQLVTFRKIYFQAYDTIIIRKSLERIEVCIDQPKKASSGSIDTLPIKVLSAAALHLNDLVGVGAIPPENLFPSMGAMYAVKTEGQVKSLAFRTVTGSIKKERMTSSSIDLRDEKFHHAGMNALGNVMSPYEITIDWQFKLPEGQATVSLSALIREIASATPTLHGCYVSSATNSAFAQAINRVITYI
ncbi:hypothetical protein [Herbaspirillum lusitanum]|uniref:hypothetical protein n=1 Tax=Herbaspirillum lusitanum TaxID=213312 RepID=UPI0012F4BFB1|nr:hypothetical protein [Herbaspirillum lusitanum]